MLEFDILVHMKRTERTTLMENDLVKLVSAEPAMTGRVRSVDANSVTVVWSDGIVCEHEHSELKVVRLEQIASTWMGLLTF